MEEPVPYEKGSNFVEIDDNSNVFNGDEYLKSMVEKEGVLVDADYQYNEHYQISLESKLYYIPSSNIGVAVTPDRFYFLGDFGNPKFDTYRHILKSE